MIFSVVPKFKMSEHIICSSSSIVNECIQLSSHLHKPYMFHPLDYSHPVNPSFFPVFLPLKCLSHSFDISNINFYHYTNKLEKKRFRKRKDEPITVALSNKINETAGDSHTNLTDLWCVTEPRGKRQRGSGDSRVHTFNCCVRILFRFNL